MNKNLVALKANNSSIDIQKQDEHYKVLKPWNDESVSFVFAKGQKLTKLKNIIFPEELVAIYHSKKKLLEYIFTPLPKKELKNYENNTFNYKGTSFKCYFGKSTKAIKILSKAFVVESTDTDSSYRNLQYFNQYFNKSGIYEKFLQNAEAVSYFVEGDFEKINLDFVTLSKTLNFYRFYFDRNAPQIIILKKQIEKANHTRPCYSCNKIYPKTINAKEIDPTILEIFSIARETKDIRLKYIFYYQILEFVSYYHLNGKLQNNLQSILKCPELSTNANEYSKKIIEEMKDHFSARNDSQKLEKTITNYCSIEDIKLELKSNCKFFSKNITFDGGLFIPKILKSQDCIECLTDADLIKVKTNVEKIRNVLVHLRESRENKVILPTDKNNDRLVPYLYIIKRLAEKVAIQFE